MRHRFPAANRPEATGRQAGEVHDHATGVNMDATLGTPDQHLINRLRKVLALTSSPMEHEAQLAAERLRELLTKHNLDMADLEEKGGRVPPSIHEAGHDLGKAAFKWKLDLAEGISEFYYCVGLVNRYSKTVTFVGRPDNV